MDLIDQNQLPWSFSVVRLRRWEQVAQAISDMTVRGAGAIGAAAAAGMALAAQCGEIEAAAAGLARTRPTARNLFHAIEVVRRARGVDAAVDAARAFIDDDAACGEAIGQHGRALLCDGARVSTHCNAGWLAFVDWGSALAPVYAAAAAGMRLSVWVDETRPRGQGARLTAWELQNAGIDHAVITDGVLASRMRAGEVDCIIVGADRIAANGDVANKVGTYGVAVLARAHGIPFYVAAPTTTIDADCPEGGAIPIEERSPDEVAWVEGPDADGVVRRVRVVAPGARCRNPAFDVTPAELIAGLVTERGVVPASPAGVASVARQ